MSETDGRITTESKMNESIKLSAISQNEAYAESIKLNAYAEITTEDFLQQEVDKIKEQIKDDIEIGGKIQFLVLYGSVLNTVNVRVNCFDIDEDIKSNLTDIYKIPIADEYYGFHKDTVPTLLDAKEDEVWTVDDAGVYFQKMIENPLGGMGAWEDSQLNEWKKKVDIKSVSNSKFFGDTFDGDPSDLWLTLIAFTGYGSHRTKKIGGGMAFKEDEDQERTTGSYFVNDVTFLSQYNVRGGFEKYGAAAFFDEKFRLTEIFLSHSDKTYKPPKYNPNTNANDETEEQKEWKHVKWAWKVSVSVAVFLVDFIGHSRFRESSGLIKAVQETLKHDHPIRQLLLPFTAGKVLTNCTLNDNLCENGLYHRAFSFQYRELQRLIRDSMSNLSIKERRDSVGLEGNDVNASEELDKPKDEMKYAFQLLRKKVAKLKMLPDEVYPIYTDVWDTWVQTLKFVEEYIQIYYNDDDIDDSWLLKDTELVQFYDVLLDNLGIAKTFPLKKFNIINILTHFVCNETIWNHHINSSVSFEYNADSDFTGLKILKKKNPDSLYSSEITTTRQNYIEYCAVILSKGWQYSYMKLLGDSDKWNAALKKDSNVKWDESDKVFTNYLNASLKTVQRNIIGRNRQRIAPYNGIKPQYMHSYVPAVPTDVNEKTVFLGGRTLKDFDDETLNHATQWQQSEEDWCYVILLVLNKSVDQLQGSFNFMVAVDNLVHFHKNRISGHHRILCFEKNLPRLIACQVDENIPILIDYRSIKWDVVKEETIEGVNGIKNCKIRYEEKYTLYEEHIKIYSSIYLPNEIQCKIFSDREKGVDDWKQVDIDIGQNVFLDKTSKDLQIYYSKSHNRVYGVHHKTIQHSKVFGKVDENERGNSDTFYENNLGIFDFAWKEWNNFFYPQQYSSQTNIKLERYLYENITQPLVICCRYQWLRDKCLYGQDNEFNIFRSMCFMNPDEKLWERMAIGISCVILQVMLSIGVVSEVINNWDTDIMFESEDNGLIITISILAFAFISLTYSFTVKKYTEWYNNIYLIFDISWVIIILDFISNMFVGFIVCISCFFYLLQSPSVNDVVLNSFALAFIIELDDMANLFESDEGQLIGVDWKHLQNGDYNPETRKREINVFQKESFTSLIVVLLSPLRIIVAIWRIVCWMIRYCKTSNNQINYYDYDKGLLEFREKEIRKRKRKEI